MFSRDRLLIGQLLLGLMGVVHLPLAACLEDGPPPSVSVVVGEGVRVPCPLAGPGASVQWLQNGAPVVLEGGRGGHREWAVSAGGEAAMAIGAARLSDAGEWGCREMAPDGGVRRTVQVLTLQVGSPPSAPYLELEGRRLLHQATVTVKEPQSLSLHCIVTGASPPVRHIHWFVGDANVSSSSELFVEFSGSEEGAYTSRSVLPLNATRALHAKEVVCLAHHATWRQGAAVSVSLNVLYEPSFSISRDPGFGLPLVEGMRVSLLCHVDANPPSPPQWVRDDGPPEGGGGEEEEEGALLFDPVDRDRHSGWYRCTTRNEAFGFFASFGYFLNVRAADPSDATLSPGSGSGPLSTAGCIPDGRPEVTAVNRSLSGLSGRSALLSGQLCSSPRPHRVFWLLRHLVLRPGDSSHPYVAHNLTETEVPGCWMVVLEVVRLSLDDSGEVVLIATNPKGAADATFLLNVTHAEHSRSGAPPSTTGVFGACALLLLLLPAWLRRTLDNR